MNVHRKPGDRSKLLTNLVQLVSPQTNKEEQMKIVGKLFQCNIDVLEECLLQVTHVCVTHTQPEVQQHLIAFMLWLGGRSLYLALRLSWMLDSISDFFLMSGVSSQVKRFHDRVETCAINQDDALPAPWDKVIRKGEPYLSSSTSAASLDPIPPMDVNVVMRKERRLKMYNDIRAFVSFLTDLSNQLRFFSDRPKRKVELRKRLAEVNQLLPSLRLMHPLGKSTDPVQWIVHIAVEECTVFSSRERAPYLIRYEVIIDDSTTMADPSKTTLRNSDGTFKVTSASEELFTLAESTNSPKENTGSAPPAAEQGVLEGSTKMMQNAFGESAAQRLSRIRAESPWGKHPNWSMRSMIVKAGDDLRQEELALQLIHTFGSIWNEAGLTLQTYPYMALPTNADSGLLEVVKDSNSMDGIKKACNISSIDVLYANVFASNQDAARLAQRNFTESLAAYSIISYILQIKDRHNGNLMICRDGKLVHIDFGFFFCTSPGGINFESAPFKLSQELLEAMGGQNGNMFSYFKVLLYQGFRSPPREKSEDILALVSLMIPFNTMPCFGTDPVAVLAQLQNRFRYDLNSEADYALYAKDLIMNSCDNWRTRRYDQFQTFQNGIL